MVRDIISNLIADAIFTTFLATLFLPYWKNKFHPSYQSFRHKLKVLTNHQTQNYCDGCEFVRSPDFWRLLSDDEIQDYFNYLRRTKNAALAIELKQNLRKLVAITQQKQIA